FLPTARRARPPDARSIACAPHIRAPARHRNRGRDAAPHADSRAHRPDRPRLLARRRRLSGRGVGPRSQNSASPHANGARPSMRHVPVARPRGDARRVVAAHVLLLDTLPRQVPGPNGMSTESALRADIVEVGRRMYARGYTASNDGNISARLGADRLLMTP